MSDESIQLTYDPLTLPTAQHRAGLAGLIVLIDSLRRRSMGPLPEVHYSPELKVTVTITEETAIILINELFNATLEEQARDKPMKNKAKEIIPPKKEESRPDPNKEGKLKTVYIYDQVVPRAGFLECLGVPAVWLKLWRDAIWSTLRGIPTTRLPYEQRSAGQDCSEAHAIWESLKRFSADLSKGRHKIEPVASSIFIGAQSDNAEKIPFRGRPDENLLLAFWPVVMGVFVPEYLDRDGKREFGGYVLAIPDVSDPESFAEDFIAMTATLDPALSGYRPRDAIITMPGEGGLEYLFKLLDLAHAKTMTKEIAFNTSGVEVYHLEKRGNSVCMLSSGRVELSREVLDDYAAIRDHYRNPILRRQLIANLLGGYPWYHGFNRVFASSPHELFLGQKAAYFPRETASKFRAEAPQRRN